MVCMFVCSLLSLLRYTLSAATGPERATVHIKSQKYRDVKDSYTFQPVACETLGSWGESLFFFLKSWVGVSLSAQMSQSWIFPLPLFQYCNRSWEFCFTNGECSIYMYSQLRASILFVAFLLSISFTCLFIIYFNI